MDGRELLLALVPLFVVVDPLASVGLFLGLTALTRPEYLVFGFVLGAFALVKMR